MEFPGSSFGARVEDRDHITGLFRGVQQGFGGSLKFHHRWAMHNPKTRSGDKIAEHWYTTGRTATGGVYMNRGVAWFRLEGGLIHDFLDFFDTESVAAFFPDGQPVTEFGRANVLIAPLLPFAPQDAAARLKALRVEAN